ncbi:hypothetical protein LPJ53_006462 [Coemansia erecta]|uniref:Uncharacterized protein n=1 Tax=Coemansia erecta TaxID=147472 RepID=A0A9W7XQ38_9FUNG|nr:hypothetical protein LPJ53_006462 [Coemansia erecta]
MAGIKHCPAKIKAALDKLHERLFFVDGEFIGPNLTLDDEEMTSKRGLDDAFVADFIGAAAFKRIFGHSPGLPALQSIPTTAQPVDDDRCAFMLLSELQMPTQPPINPGVRPAVIAATVCPQAQPSFNPSVFLAIVAAAGCPQAQPILTSECIGL